MQQVQPRVFVVAETTINRSTMELMLQHLGADGWHPDATNDGEELVEVGGRLCYKSFSTDLNKNLTRIREGNKDYLNNILKQKHGSVLEHSSSTVVMLNVSRILTHELVRHRAGMAFSQESMRFVRLDDIPVMIPDLTHEFTELLEILPDKDPDDARELQGTFIEDFKDIIAKSEKAITFYSQLLDHPLVPFSLKKHITSALRRMAPGGHATNIMATGNHRSWRHMIEMRTAEGAEEEIRLVFGMIAREFNMRYPHLYQDMKASSGEDGLTHYYFDNPKV